MDASAHLRAATRGRDVRTSWPLVEDVLRPFRSTIGGDWDGYRHHVLRVLNFCDALAGDDGVPESLIVAAAFHDLGIWTHDTFDYLAPSAALARAHVCAHRHGPDIEAVERAIAQHHRVRPIRDDPASEMFRRADWIDVSCGVLRFGVAQSFVAQVRRALPDRGFHARLVQLGLRQFRRTPLKPLPMLRW